MKIKYFQDLEEVELLFSFAGRKFPVYVFIIDGLLIDTGPIKKQEILISLYNERNITEVILTHHHEDHTGMANWLQQNKKVPIYIHKSGMENCIGRMKLPAYRKYFSGERKPFRSTALEATHNTANYTWDVIHTPGHAHDHVALYNREKKWMFGGDLYVNSTPKSIFEFESIPTIIQSLHTILTYDFETYICAHAGIIHNGRRAIENKLNYLVSVEQQVLLLYNKGKSRREIRKKLFPKNHPMNYITLFENSPQHIVNSILE